MQTIDDVARLIFNNFPQESLRDAAYNVSLGKSAACVDASWRVIDYDVFMDAVRGHMNAARKSVVLDTFYRMDFDNDGYLKIHEIQALFNAQKHPVVVSDGLYTAEKLLRWFLSVWDCDNSTKQHGLVPLCEFFDYYNGLSATIDDDDVFISIVRTS
uniref:Crustacean calcium-binding protein 23 n=1 Tax=Lygus hesperus TaxID=30085 RepID=A0A0A9WX73_LYGHE